MHEGEDECAEGEDECAEGEDECAEGECAKGENAKGEVDVAEAEDIEGEGAAAEDAEERRLPEEDVIIPIHFRGTAAGSHRLSASHLITARACSCRRETGVNNVVSVKTNLA